MQIMDFQIDPDLREMTEHRTIVLPLACYQTTIRKHMQGHIPLHWHEEFQFVRVMKGQADFQVQDRHVRLNEGEGLFINSGCLHMATDEHRTGCVYICLNVAPSFVVSQELYSAYVYPYMQATNLPYVRLNAEEGWANAILEAIVAIHQLVELRPAHYELDITAYLARLWKNLIANGFPLEYEQAEMLKNRRMKAMLDWIHRHYNEKVLLDDIARAGQLSRSECCRYFKRMLRTSPVQYVMDVRIRQSLVLLQQPERSVTDVAYQVGFNSTSYFIQQFRQSMNMTPMAYKKSTQHGLSP